MLRQPQGSTCGQVEEVQLSAAQEGAYKAKYYELLEQHVALQAKYAALLEEQQKNKSE
jgi:hypothetical protein